MTPDKTAELRRLYDEYQRTRALMVESVPVPGGPETGWSAACEANAAARSAWVELLHKHEADLLATAEREAVLREALCEIRSGLSEWRRLDIICPALAEDMRSKIDAALETKGGEP